VAGIARRPPKQFLPLFGARSTFQDTLHRVSDPRLFGRPVIVTNTQYRFLVAEQLAEIGVEADILLEPVRRDSGPAIAAGAAFAAKRDGDPIIVALAADHVISDPAAFAEVCRLAADAAGADRIVTFGSARRVRQPNMATSAPAHRSARKFLPSTSSSKSRTRQMRSATSSRVISGIAETSCFAPVCCLMNIKTLNPTALTQSCNPSSAPAAISISSPSMLNPLRAPARNRSTMR
jgi:hypothetical protein